MEQYNRMIVDGTPVFAGAGAVALAIPAPEVALQECADRTADTAASPSQSSAQTAVRPSSTTAAAAADTSAGEQLEGLENRPVYRFVKRAFDIVFSALVLVLFCWLYLIIAIAVKVDDPHGPVFFKQTRVTKGGREFSIIKFRSMIANAEDNVEDYLTPEQLAQWKDERKVDDDPRMTRVGKIIRKTSLDEFPQFVNVLIGDLSVVGPRPLTQDELLQHFTEEQRKRLLSVPAGITGLWQTGPRNKASFDTGERQKIELSYVDHASIGLDMKCIVKTVDVMFGKHRSGQ